MRLAILEPGGLGVETAMEAMSVQTLDEHGPASSFTTSEDRRNASRIKKGLGARQSTSSPRPFSSDAQALARTPRRRYKLANLGIWGADKGGLQRYHVRRLEDGRKTVGGK